MKIPNLKKLIIVKAGEKEETSGILDKIKPIKITLATINKS